MSNSAQAQKHFERGNQFFDQDNFKNAIAEWRTALELAPEFDNVRFNLALAYAKDGQTDLAIEQFDLVIARDSADVEARHELVDVLIQAKRMDDAIEELEEILDIAPNDVQAQGALAEIGKQARGNAQTHFERGVQFYDQQDFARAIVAWEHALELDPDFTNARFNLGLAYSEIEKLDLAIQTFRRVLEDEPDDLNARHELAEIYFETDKTEQAIEELYQALMIEPEDLIAREMLEEYDAHLSTEQESNVAAEQHYQHGDAFDEMGDTANAITEWQEAIALNPHHAGAHYNLGIAYADEQKWNAAIDELETTVELEPYDPDARRELAQIYFEQGELDQAENQLRRVLNLVPGEARAAHLLAQIYIEQKKWDQAVAALEQSAMLEDDAELWITLGNVYKQTSHTDDAVLAYRRALIANPQDAQAKQALARLGASLDDETSES